MIPFRIIFRSTTVDLKMNWPRYAAEKISVFYPIVLWQEVFSQVNTMGHNFQKGHASAATFKMGNHVRRLWQSAL